MSSGSLPQSAYHRAESLGAGTYGSVLTVYNDEGEEYALKLFLDDDEDEEEDEYPMLDIGAMREISILRLLRAENSHENIVQIADVQTGVDEESEDGINCLTMAMPLYRDGTLCDAIEKRLLQNRVDKVSIAHGLLKAVAHLHDNGIIHRDIKTENIMLEKVDGVGWKCVLIDFSLAKLVNASMYGGGNEVFIDLNSEKEVTHTGEVGTVTYQAPEVMASKPYGLSSDLWSVGVVLLEMINSQILPTSRNKQAVKLIEVAKEKLPDQPFANLVRRLLEVDPSLRITAREALLSPLFVKFGMENPKRTVINIAAALPFDKDENEENQQNHNSNTRRENSKKNATLRRRMKTILRICNELRCTHPLTKQAALACCEQMTQLDDTLDDLSQSQSLLDCVVLANKFFEMDPADLTSLDILDTGMFSNWSLEQYADNEATIWMLMDFCLYPRTLYGFDG